MQKIKNSCTPIHFLCLVLLFESQMETSHHPPIADLDVCDEITERILLMMSRDQMTRKGVSCVCVALLG